MFETTNGYVFQTFQDGKVIFFMDSYNRHCGYRDEIRGERGRDAIQDALIYPHYVVSYPEKNESGRITARYKKYIKIININETKRGPEFEYWEIILKKKPKTRKRIATAYITSSLKYAIINDRIEKIKYQRYKKIRK